MKPWLLVQTSSIGVWHLVKELAPPELYDGEPSSPASHVVCRPWNGSWHGVRTIWELTAAGEPIRVCRRCRRCLDNALQHLEDVAADIENLSELGTRRRPATSSTRRPPT